MDDENKVWDSCNIDVNGAYLKYLGIGGTNTYLDKSFLMTYSYTKETQNRSRFLNSTFGKVVLTPVAIVGDVVTAPFVILFYPGIG